jgi:hypothetical protein
MKKEYIKMRNSGQVNYDLLYMIAKDKGLTLNHHEFMFGIQFLNISQVIETLDQEFELTLLYNEDNTFIKAIE